MIIQDSQAFKDACRNKEYRLGRVDFSRAPLSGSMLCGDATHTLVLEQAQFTSTDLRLAHCFGWKLSRGEFNQSRCAGAIFQGCEFDDVMFHRVTYWEKDVPEMPTRFVDSTFLFGQFEGEVLESVVFKGCGLRGANFKNCNLSHARFLDCDLSGADFKHASMDGVNLYGSTLTAGQLSNAEAGDWSTVGVGKTGLTIDQLHRGL